MKVRLTVACGVVPVPSLYNHRVRPLEGKEKEISPVKFVPKHKVQDFANFGAGTPK